MAKLYFRYGAMNSGKSTALMQVAHNYEEQGMRVLILKPKVDTKGSGDLVSRLGVRRPADLLVPPDMDLVEAVRAASSEGRPLACVLCDESQFLTAEQAEQLGVQPGADQRKDNAGKQRAVEAKGGALGHHVVVFAAQ